MKKLLLSAILAVCATSASAGMFSTVSGMNMPEIKPSNGYTIDTAGFNPRIYEFTPKFDSNKICIIAFSSSDGSSSSQMDCFDKKK